MVDSKSVANVVVVRGAAVDPVGDMITCDVAPEDASYIIGDLRRMGLADLGAIDIDEIDSSISAGSRLAEESAIGKPADSVIWENVSARIDNEGLLSGGMVALFAFSGVIAAVAILIDSSPIVVGAMALCPDFGPIAAFAAPPACASTKRCCAACASVIAKRRSRPCVPTFPRPRPITNSFLAPPLSRKTTACTASLACPAPRKNRHESASISPRHHHRRNPA